MWNVAVAWKPKAWVSGSLPCRHPRPHISEWRRNQSAFSPPETIFPEVSYLGDIWTAAAPAVCQKPGEKRVVSSVLLGTETDLTKQNNRKELNPDICSNMNESQKHYAEGKKQDT